MSDPAAPAECEANARDSFDCGLVAVDASEAGAADAGIDAWCRSGAADSAHAVSREAGDTLGATTLRETFGNEFVVGAVGWVGSTLADGAAVTRIGGATAAWTGSGAGGEL